jgi:hypothetical protein
MQKILFFLIISFCFIGPTHAALYQFNGVFGSDATTDSYEGDMFGTLENQSFSGLFDDTTQYFNFQTNGYVYEDDDVAGWLDYNAMNLIFVEEGVFFDVRDTDGAPTALWIKYGTAMIGGEVDASAVPVPAAIWLLGTGIVGLLGLRKKMNC